VFEQFESHVLNADDVQQISDHSLAVSNSARKIALLEHADQRTQDESFTAGMLHDAGKLILASTLGTEYGQVLEYSAKANVGVFAAEREVLGCSHGQIAAYLFGLWGLPGTIVEAVAWHHEPAESLSVKFSPLAAVHAASAYHDEESNSRLRDRTPIDAAFLAGIGCAEREKVWRSKLDVDEQ
jgi:HD-like signal output (HDOD) protein